MLAAEIFEAVDRVRTMHGARPERTSMGGPQRHPCSEQINFCILDSGIAQAFRNLGSYFFVITLIFGDQQGIVFQIERQAKAAFHSARAPISAMTVFASCATRTLAPTRL